MFICGTGAILQHKDVHLQKKLKDRKGQPKASLWNKFPDWRHFKVILGNFNQQIGTVMPELSRNRLCLITSFPTGHITLANICQGQARNRLATAGCAGAITEIGINHIGKDVIDEVEIPLLKPSQLMQFIKALRLNRQL